MLKEIEQVSKLLETSQTGACLAYIETLEKDHQDCACLTAAKLAVYRHENRWEEALNLAGQFHRREPENPSAASEYALALVVAARFKESVSVLIDAFERTKSGAVHTSVLNTALQIGAYLLHNRLLFPAIGIGNQLKEFQAVAEPANALLYRATSDPAFPILLRDTFFDYECPAHFPGKAEFDEAINLLRLMRWKESLAKMESLTVYAGSWPVIWRNIAALRFWLLENEQAREALKTFTALPNTPPEDAADAEAMRLLLTPDAFGDKTHLLTVEYPITDAEKAFEKLLSDPKYFKIEVPNRQPNFVPPKGTFILLDRPFPVKGTPITLETVASQSAACLLFGKETDRAARLMIHSVTAADLAQVESQLSATLGDTIGLPGKTLQQDPISQSRVLTQYRFRFSEETYPEPAEIETLIRDYYLKEFIDRWSHLPMGLFGGKTPAEAANDPSCKISLAAAVAVLEMEMPEEIGTETAQCLRQKFGLPLPEKITPAASSSEEEAFALLVDHPAWRWHRFDTEKMSTETLAQGLQIIAGMQEQKAMRLFAQELLNRPMNSMPFPVRVLAFETLINVSETAGKIDEALLWVERAKNESAAQSPPIPDAAWRLHEITLRLMQGDIGSAEKVFQYLTVNYRNDPNVMGALQELFVRLGMLNPDGTPSAAMQRAKHEPAAVPPQEAELWTPEAGSRMPPAQTGGAPKLWVPE
jgi:Flp pilus assembly protein TadD